MRHTWRPGAILALAMPVFAMGLARGAQAAPLKPVVGHPDDFALSAQDWSQVNSGGIIVHHRTLAGTQVNEFFSAGYVDAPVDEVFAFYQHYQNTPLYQDSVKRITQIASSGHYRQLDYQVQLPFPIGHRHFVLDLEGAGVPGERGAIWWSYDHGDIRQMQGSYVVSAAGPDRTLVKYHILADMKTWIPSWLVGFVQGGTIPNVVEAARKDYRPVDWICPCRSLER